ncbi:cadherin repeat domain-containing protein [Chitinophaga sedimenti]|uniref:cadherin domain-containing protein n=1 Tax=Chitinophaga sedimenti TaxID=2033606 RepID=UPI0020069B77|nr:cadherin repeat domain-containing protein [Chitinophaga sedimenti]MCK7554777.1 cadherin repeat domain-containing protein [Chitinophaga sedimenti]
MIDGIRPTITSVAVPANDTYIAGETLSFTANFSENITVAGSPYLSVQVGGSALQAPVTSTTANSITFTYTVANGHLDADGVGLNSIQLAGGTIRDAAGNDAILVLNNTGVLTGVLVDAVAPSINSVTVPADKLYTAPETLDFSITYSEPVIVTGTPVLGITIGSNLRSAAYTSTSGNTLNFRYTITGGDLDRDGIAVATSLTFTGGASIRDAAGNNAANTLTVPSTTGVLVDAVRPIITAGQTFSIAENSAAGTAVGTVAGIDPGSSGTLQNWTITTNANPNGNASNAFTINAATGAITVNDAGDLDYEANTSFTLTLTVSDGVNTSVATTIVINITDVNEPPTDITLSANSIAENNAVNAGVGTLSTTSAQGGATYTYTLVNGTGDTDNSQFTISGNTLQAAASFDYETKNSYSIRVRTTSNTGLTFEKTFTVNVTNVNEPPTDITLARTALRKTMPSTPTSVTLVPLHRTQAQPLLIHW